MLSSFVSSRCAVGVALDSGLSIILDGTWVVGISVDLSKLNITLNRCIIAFLWRVGAISDIVEDNHNKSIIGNK